MLHSLLLRLLLAHALIEPYKAPVPLGEAAQHPHPPYPAKYPNRMLFQPALHHPRRLRPVQQIIGQKQQRLNGPAEIRKPRYVLEQQRIIEDGAGFEVGAAAEGDVSKHAGDHDDSHEAVRRLVSLHCDVASTQTGDRLAIHGYHSRSSFGIGRHGRLDGYEVGCAVGREDGQAVETDVDQVSIPSGEAGEVGVVLEVADQRVLVIIVHVGDDALLRCFVCALGGSVRHCCCNAHLQL